MKISFVIPCYRSEDTILSVLDEISNKMQERPQWDFEIITVNDCSPDRVYHVLFDAAKRYSNLKVIDFAKNMGKHAALMAGYSHTEGDIIVNLDDDGQCPVDRLWDLIEPLKNGYDVTLARYSKKQQSGFKNFGSAVNAWMTRYLLEKPKDLQLSNFCAMKRFICDEILRYHNPYPYIDGLLLRSTNKIKNVDMEERERISGTTGYTFKKSIMLWLNGFTAFSVKPLRLASILGFIIAFIGFVAALLVVVQKIITPEVAAGYSSLMAVILLVGGIIMVLLGLIGEYIGRIYICINHSPQYVIRSTINTEPKQTDATDAAAGDQE